MVIYVLVCQGKTDVSRLFFLDFWPTLAAVFVTVLEGGGCGACQSKETHAHLGAESRNFRNIFRDTGCNFFITRNSTDRNIAI